MTGRWTLALVCLAVVVGGCTSTDAPSSTSTPYVSFPDPPEELSSDDPERSCSSRYAKSGDIDGDGQLDQVFRIYDGAVFLGACTAAGVVTQVERDGMGGFFDVIDIEPDGRAEIIEGGTSVGARFMGVYVLDGSRLHRLSLGEGPLTLISGLDVGWFESEGKAWGCEDVTGDGRRELVQVEVDSFDGAAGAWRKRAYAIRGLRVEMVRESTGRIFAPDGVGTPWKLASRILGSWECGFKEG